MRPSALVLLSLVLAGPPIHAEDAPKPAAPSGDEIASFALEGFDLGSIQAFAFAPDIGTCLVDLTMSLGPLGILAVEEGHPPDVIADCATVAVEGEARGATDLRMTTVSLSDPRTHLIVWCGSDASTDAEPPVMVQRVVDRLRADRAAQARP